MLLWQKLIESDYVCDIAKHPQKTYTTRLRNEGKLYDFAAVARQDTAEDGTDAVNIMSSAEGRKYDLIFMDIQMPKMDGYTATREIRTLNNHKCANIPIIAMTANAFEEDRKKAVKAGMNGHIAKPISVDVILENLDQIFE